MEISFRAKPKVGFELWSAWRAVGPPQRQLPSSPMEPLLPGREDDNNTSAFCFEYSVAPREAVQRAKVVQRLRVTRSSFLSQVLFATSENWDAGEVSYKSRRRVVSRLSCDCLNVLVFIVRCCVEKPHPAKTPLAWNHLNLTRTNCVCKIEIIQEIKFLAYYMMIYMIYIKPDATLLNWSDQ